MTLLETFNLTKTINWQDLPVQSQADIIEYVISIDKHLQTKNIWGFKEFLYNKKDLSLTVTFKDVKNLITEDCEPRQKMLNDLKEGKNLFPIIIKDNFVLDGKQRVMVSKMIGENKICCIDISNLLNIDWELEYN